MRNMFRVVGVLALGLTWLFSLNDLSVSAQGPVSQDSPLTAITLGNPVPAIPAHAAQWIRFDYVFTSSQSPRPTVTIRLLNAVQTSQSFEVWSPERMQGNWLENEPVGRGAPEVIPGCTQTLPDDSIVKCTTNDLFWVGGFGALGVYYVRIVNNGDSAIAPQLVMSGPGLGQCVNPSEPSHPSPSEGQGSSGGFAQAQCPFPPLRPTPSPGQAQAATATAAATATLAATPTPTSTPTAAVTATPAATPTAAATTVPTATPTVAATPTPTVTPTSAATSAPAVIPTTAATSAPAATATSAATSAPAVIPTVAATSTSAVTATSAATSTSAVIPTSAATFTLAAVPTTAATSAPAATATSAATSSPAASLTRVVTPTVAATATPSAVASPALPGTTKNQATVDITLNETGEWTIGGFSRKALGLGPIDSQAAQMAKDLNSAHLLLQAELVTVDVNGTPLLKLQWTPASRQVVADLAAKYGYAISPQVMVRIEEWITSSTLDVTARYSNDMSKPLILHLTKPVVVDLGPEGQLTVEKLPLALTLDPGVFQTIKQAGVRNAVVCWNNGTLTTKVDGADLPLIMLDPKGVRMLSQALGLGIENSVDPFFSDLLGVDVSLPGGTHQTGITCGN